MRNQIVILAAGKGTRMGNSNVPKVLVMLKNKPLILYILEQVEKINQLLKPIIVVGYMADKVRAVLGNDYTYALQKQQLGTAHAVMAALPYVEAENVLVLYGDMPFITAESLQSLMRAHHEKKSILSMFTATVASFDGEFSSLYSYGRIIRDASGNITKSVELKDATEEQKKITEVNPCIYMFNTPWLEKSLKLIQNTNNQKEYYLTDLVEIAIRENIQIHSFPLDPREVIGVNSMEDLKKAESLF